jgi:hypothetical protein
VESFLKINDSSAKQQMSALLRKQKIHCRDDKSPPLNCVVSHINPLGTLLPGDTFYIVVVTNQKLKNIYSNRYLHNLINFNGNFLQISTFFFKAENKRLVKQFVTEVYRAFPQSLQVNAG